MNFFCPTDSIRQTYLHISFPNSERAIHILVFDANKIEMVEFTQESVFMGRKPCAELESEFDV